MTPTSRMRAGNGPARRLTIEYSVVSQPSREQLAETQHGRVEALDVADLDRDARRPRRRARSRAPRRASPRAASRRAPAGRARSRRCASGQWNVVGAAMTMASSCASRIIASGSDHACAPDCGDRGGDALRRPGPRPRRASPRRGREITRTWLRPIEPSPTSPMRSGAVIARTGRGDVSHGVAPAMRRPRSLVASSSGCTGIGEDLVRQAVGDRKRQVGRARDIAPAGTPGDGSGSGSR